MLETVYFILDIFSLSSGSFQIQVGRTVSDSNPANSLDFHFSNAFETVQEALKWGSITITLGSLTWNDTAQHERHQRKTWSPISGFWSHPCAGKKWINFTSQAQRLNLHASCREETSSSDYYPHFPDRQNTSANYYQLLYMETSFYQHLSLPSHCS